jgi:hypothetical protein
MLTVLTWNVENFFTPAAGDQDAYEEKVAELTAVITTAAPDLVGLQEVGDTESFEELRGLCCVVRSQPMLRRGLGPC